MNKIMGSSIATAIRSAASSARMLRPSRMVEAKVRSASLILVPNRSDCTRTATSRPISCTPVRSDKCRIATIWGEPK